MAYFSNPSEWFNGLSGLFGGEGGWGEQAMNTLGNAGQQVGNWASQPQNAMGLLAGAGTAMGAAGQIYGANQMANRSQELSRLARQPIDPNQFYRPMSEAARQGYARQLNADMATAGTPMDSSYARGMTAEGLAKSETERWNQAAQLAGQNRWAQMQAMGMRPQFPAIGDTSAMGNYMKWRALMSARERGMNQTPSATAPGASTYYLDPSRNYMNEQYGAPTGQAGTPGMYDKSQNYMDESYGERAPSAKMNFSPYPEDTNGL